MLSIALVLASLVFAPPSPVNVASSDGESHGKLTWFEGSYEQLLAEAKAKNKVVFIDLWRHNCGWCDKLSKETFGDDSVVGEMKDILCFNIDGQSAEGRPLSKQFKVTGFPTLVWLSPDGSLRERIPGYLPPDKFKQELTRIRADKGTFGGLRREIEANPDDVELRSALARKLNSIGDEPGATQQIEAIRKLDPEGKSLAMHQIAFEGVMAQIDRGWKTSKTLDTALLEQLLAKETYPAVLYDGWNRLSGMYDYLAREATSAGDTQLVSKQRANVVAALRNVWKYCPEADRGAVGNSIADGLYNKREGLSAEDKQFALDVARQAVDASPSDDCNVIDTLACCLSMNGRTEDAIVQIKRCIALQPENTQWTDRLAEITK